MSLQKIVVAILAVLSSYSVYGQEPEIIISSPHVTSWGDWGELELCPAGSFVYGMRLTVEFDSGDLSDDSALNTIELLCTSPMGKRPSNISEASDLKEFAVISSLQGHAGVVGVLQECPIPGFAVGFQLRSEDDQGWLDDDTAANNLKLFCSTGEILEGYGDTWGDWTAEQHCPRGLQICGIQTQVEPETDDDTSLNNVNMACCNV